jgi:hypothetical protein
VDGEAVRWPGVALLRTSRTAGSSEEQPRRRRPGRLLKKGESGNPAVAGKQDPELQAPA